MRYTYRALVMSVGILGLLGSGHRNARAGESEYDRETLKGLQGVEVVVENLDQDIERTVLTKGQIQTEVEVLLRHAGVAVLSREEDLEAPGRPYLYVNVNIFKPGAEPLYVYALAVELRQGVRLARDQEVLCFAATWSTGYVGIVGSNKLQEIRAHLADDVDEFANAYLAVNADSKKRGQ